MPFISGGELDRIFIKQRRLVEPEVKFYIAQIVIAVGKLHEKGIVHRDLKLSNILVDATGYVKIIDFGLAKQLNDDDFTSSFAGTIKYLSPEALMSQGANKAVDWWALGVILFEMMFGDSPFRGESQHMISD